MQENGEDIGKSLVTDGLVTVEKRKEKRLQKVLEEYTRAQDTARKARVCMTMKQLERRQFVSLGTRRELEPRNAVVSGIVTGDAPVGYLLACVAGGIVWVRD